MKKVCLFSLLFLFLLSGCAGVHEVCTPDNEVKSFVVENQEKKMTESILFQHRVATTGAIEAEAAAYQATDLGFGTFDCGTAIYADFNGNVDNVSGYSWDNGVLNVYNSEGNYQSAEFIYVALFNNREYETNWRLWLLVDGLMHSFSVDDVYENVAYFDVCVPSYSYCLVPVSMVVETVVQQSEHFIALMYANDMENPNAYPITVSCRNLLELHDKKTISSIPLEYIAPEIVGNEQIGIDTYISWDLEGREQLLVYDDFKALKNTQCVFLQIVPDQTVSYYISYVFFDNNPSAKIAWEPHGTEQIAFSVELQIPFDEKEHQLYALHVAADPTITNIDVRAFPIQSSTYRLIMKKS